MYDTDLVLMIVLKCVLGEVECDCVNWINFLQDREKGQAVTSD